MTEQEELEQIARPLTYECSVIMHHDAVRHGPIVAGWWWQLKGGATVEVRVWWNAHKRPDRVLCGEVRWNVKVGDRECRAHYWSRDLPNKDVTPLIEQLRLWWLDAPIFGRPMTMLERV